jgi:hypothetical protein
MCLTGVEAWPALLMGTLHVVGRGDRTTGGVPAGLGRFGIVIELGYLANLRLGSPRREQIPDRSQDRFWVVRRYLPGH